MGIKTRIIIKNQLPAKSIKNLLDAIVFSHLGYSSLYISSIWNSLSPSLERPMNWVLKYVFLLFIYKVSVCVMRLLKVFEHSRIHSAKIITFFHYNKVTGKHSINVLVFTVQIITLLMELVISYFKTTDNRHFWEIDCNQILEDSQNVTKVRCYQIGPLQ